MQFTKILILFLLINNAFAQVSKMPKLLTKQALEYLRFIDSSGKYTYYQTSKGSLNITSNFDNHVLLENEKGAHYLVYSHKDSKMVIVELIEKLHSKLSINKNHKIYYSRTGEKKISFITSGRSPRFTLNDTWLSYYDSSNKHIIAKSLNSNKTYQVKMINPVNNFFIPQIDMLNPETIIYTDINSSGHMALLAFNATDKKFEPIYKTKFSGSKVEFCRVNDKLIIGDFSIYDTNRGSSLSIIPIFNNPKYQNKKVIYRSEQSDLGNIICDKDNIYFIKSLKFNSNLNSRHTEVAKLDLKTNKLTIESDLKNVTQLIEMGNKILVPYRDNFYIIKGDYDTTKQDRLGK